MKAATTKLTSLIERAVAFLNPLSKRIEEISARLAQLSYSNREIYQELQMQHYQIVRLAVQNAVLQRKIQEQEQLNREVVIMEDPEQPRTDKFAVLLKERADNQAAENELLYLQVERAEAALLQKKDALRALQEQSNADLEATVEELRGRIRQQKQQEEARNQALVTRIPPDSFSEMPSAISEGAAGALHGCQGTPSLLAK